MTTPGSDPKAVFIEAIEQSTPEELSAYLDRACGNDSQLRARVDELLKAHQRAGGFLNGSATVSDTVDIRLTSPRPGTRIGPYTIRRQIGEGGMGVVYLADQSKPVKRRLALKIIKPGMDSRKVIARFQAERQALAIMDHPNIAKVLDAGQTDAGSPYFAMELVRGIPITHYCDEQHLTPHERLKLFIPVCLAVQHAHQKGVIHRDIKPGNILVTQVDGRPVPKVIDFGVAKAAGLILTDQSLFTEPGQIVGTLEYMSPEQANANQPDIDTRSDIYSLGVLLYELLTGSPPIERHRLKTAALEEILRMIREEEPPKPSARLTDSATLPSIAANRQVEPQRLTSVVRGELDWIVMKAIEKDRARRYQSASDFAMDVQRYLDDEPILARPVSQRERVARWLRRNPVIATATSVSAAVIVSAVGIAFLSITESRNEALSKAEGERQANIKMRAALDLAQDERKKAEVAVTEQGQLAEEAKAVSDYLVLSLISAADPQLTLGRQLTVRQLLDQSAAHVAVALPKQPRTEAAIRAAIGKAYFSLGLYEDSFTQLNAAYITQKKLLGEDHPQTLATAFHLNETLHAKGKYGDEQELEEQTLAALVEQYGNKSPQVLTLRSRMAIRLDVQTQYEQSEQLFDEVWQQQIETLGRHHESTLATMINLALNRMHRGRLSEGETILLETIEVLQRKHGTEDRDVMHAKRYLAMNLERQHRLVEAEAMYREVLDGSRRLLGAEHPNTLQALNSVAVILNARHRHEEAIAIYDELVAEYRRVLGPLHPDTLAIEHNCGKVLMVHGDHERSEQLLNQVWKQRIEVLGREHEFTLTTMACVAQNHMYRERLQDGENLHREVIEIMQRIHGPEHPDVLNTRKYLAMNLDRQKRFAEAEAIYREVLEISRRVQGAEHPDTLKFADQLAVHLLSQNQFDEAVRIYDELVVTCRRVLGPRHPDTLATAYHAGSTLLAHGDYAQSGQLLDEVWKLQIEVLGREHESTLATMVNLALNRVHQGQLKDGENLLREVIDVRRRKHGPEDPDLLNAQNTLAMNLDQQNRFAEAEAIYREVLETSRRTQGDEHSVTLAAVSNLANTLDHMGRVDEATQLSVDLLETYRRLFGPRHPETLIVANNTGMRLMEKRDFAAAERELKAVAEIAEEVLGPSHPHTLQVLVNLSQSLVYQENIEEAEAVLSRVVAAGETVPGREVANTLKAMTGVVGLRLRLGKKREARQLGTRAVAYCRNVFGPEDKRTLMFRNKLAMLFMNMGDNVTATREFTELINILTRLHGDSTDVMPVMSNLASTLGRQGKTDEAIKVLEQISAMQQRIMPADHPSIAQIAKIIKQVRLGNTDVLNPRADTQTTQPPGASKTTPQTIQPSAP